MLFKNITILDENFDVVKDIDVLVKGSKIEKIGKNLDANGEEVYDGAHKLLIPGFVNTHSHIPMTLLRGYGENLPLDKWLNDRIFPFEDKLTGEACYWGSLLGIAEMLKSGVSSFTDMYFFYDDILKAVAESGIKINFGRPMMCFDESHLKNLDRFTEFLELKNRYHNTEDGRIISDIALHAEYTSTECVVKELAEYAKEIGLNMHVHMSETQKEHKECMERHSGKSPAKYFYDNGLFDVKTTAAHCVWVTDEDMDLMLEKGVSVAHCPQSNLKLGSGIAPIYKMVQKGLNVTLGTDGAASNNNLDFLEEMQTAALLQKGANCDATALSIKDVLKIATINGAISQGRINKGLIKEGYVADLVVLDLDKPHLCPCHDISANLMFSANSNDICLNMIDGKIVYKNGVFANIDIEKVMFSVSKHADDIRNSL